MFAALCSLTLLTAGCDNSPAAKQADADKKAVNAEANAMKTDIDAELPKRTRPPSTKRSKRPIPRSIRKKRPQKPTRSNTGFTQPAPLCLFGPAGLFLLRGVAPDGGSCRGRLRRLCAWRSPGPVDQALQTGRQNRLEIRPHVPSPASGRKVSSVYEHHRPASWVLPALADAQPARLVATQRPSDR